MSQYPQLSNPDFYKISEEIRQWWKENQIFEQSVSSREGKETFTFYEGPPSANGTPGIHHVMARTIKDIFCRYQTLKGKQVKRKGGWDTHGLPIELQVEKELGITKDDIGKKISVEDYNQKCREAVMKFTDQWNELTEMMGYWVDLNDPYITYKNDYIETLWFLLKKLYDKGLLYKGYTIQPYSPAAGTGLSSHELNQPGTYKEVKDVSIVAQFKVKGWEKRKILEKLSIVQRTLITHPISPKDQLKNEREEVRVLMMSEFRKVTMCVSSTGQVIRLGSSGIKEILSFSASPVEVTALRQLPEIIEKALYVESLPSKKSDGTVFHYYLSRVATNEQEFLCKLVVRQVDKTHLLYDLDLKPIKKPWLEDVTQITQSDVGNLPRLRKDTRFLSLLSTENSKFLETVPKGTSQPYILAWTTTPWTLPSNSALTVGKNIDYQLIETFNPYTHLSVSVVCAKDRVGAYFPEAGKDGDFTAYKSGDKIIPWKVVGEWKGSDLEGVEYEQLMPYVTPNEPAFRVILGDFVTTEDGTGVVHTAPTFGADDFRVAQQNGIPAIMVTGEDGKPMPLVNKQGRFVKEVTDFALEPVKEQYLSDEEKEHERHKQGREKYLSVDERIGIKLKTENKAFNVQKFDHTYPHCWRTDKPVLYYPLDSWFIKTTAVKDKMIALNKQINWKPESTGTGRFGNWLENLVDWNLSRSRYWGTPLPIWRTEDGMEELCIGSVAQLIKELEYALKSEVLSNEEVKLNRDFLKRAKQPHPKSFSKGEGLEIQAGNVPLSSGEGLGVRSEYQEPRTWLKFIATTDPKTWKNLKLFARDNRKNPTEAEELLWQAVRNKALGVKIRRQHAILDFIVDFVSISKKLVIEIDGEYHKDPYFKEYDQLRTEFLNANGFQVIRFTNEEVLQNLSKVKETIRQKITELSDQKKDLSDVESLLDALRNMPEERADVEVEVKGELDLHRPFVDDITLVSPSGKPMKREPDLIDVWFDSGAMPYAQWHYPFENQEVFEKNFPADFISEGVDQTRGWFFTLHAIASMLSDDEDIAGKLSPAFKNVVSTGLVLDKDGEKMSKRKGNVINPFEALPKYGPDPVRWYMITNTNPWDNLKFNLDGVTEVRNKFFGTLANTYNFFALYANIDGYQVQEFDRVPYTNLTELDRWILSKLNSLVAEVDGYYADYEPTKAGRAIQDFVCDQLSNWYVRLGRKRFWRGEMTENKQAAYETLQHCLLTVSQLMSPIAPFFGEWLYRSITNPVREVAKEKQTPLRWESVHLTELHPTENQWIDKELEASMDLAQRVSSLCHSLRKTHKLKVRQPLSRLLVPLVSAEFKKQLASVEDLILSEVNIKHLEYVDDASGLVEKSAKPNFKKLGKSLGPKLKAFSALVTDLSQAQINEYERNGELKVVLEGEEMTLITDDLEIRSENIPGWVVASDAEITVAIDLSLTDELKMEGIARDVVNRVQNQRKDMGLEVLDRISLKFEKTSNDLVTNALLANKEYICVETQADSLEIVGSGSLANLLELDEVSLTFEVEKA